MKLIHPEGRVSLEKNKKGPRSQSISGLSQRFQTLGNNFSPIVDLISQQVMNPRSVERKTFPDTIHFAEKGGGIGERKRRRPSFDHGLAKTITTH
jgi:hypothetical protein